MFIEPKIDKPLRIRLGLTENKILADDSCSKDYPLTPGVVVGHEHYGFSLIVDTKSGQRETIYPTQCNIQAVGLDNGILKIYENHKKNSWRFNKKGDLEHSNLDEFTEDVRSVYDLVAESPDFFVGDYKVDNPISIRIKEDPTQSVVIFDKPDGQDEYPLAPGVMIGALHYGFILVIDTENGEKEIVYPTQGNIDGVGTDSEFYTDFRVFENGKYHPWVFSSEGKLIKKASYNAYSKKDITFIKETYTVDEEADKQFVKKGKQL